MGLLLFYILLALGVSFLCSVMEAVLLSVTPSYVALLEKEGSPVGKKLNEFKNDIDRPLAAILSLNTIAHTIGAAGAGAQAAAVFKDMSVAVFSAVLTLLILVLSEIIPKTLGAVYWKPLVPSVVRLLSLFLLLLWPLVFMSKVITNLISGGKSEKTISREELGVLAEIGKEEGVIAPEESRILQSLLRFRSLEVKDIMTPRTVMFSLPETKRVEEILADESLLVFSRIPIYGENQDDMKGYVLKDELLLKAAQGGQTLTLSELRRDLLHIPTGMKLDKLFDKLLATHENIALVVDEYGGVSGIATLEDLVETLLGMEFVDEADSVKDMQELARKKWRERAKKLGILEESKEENSTATVDKGEESL